MICIAYNDTAFRALFPAYANPTLHMMVAIQARWDMATAYISNRKGGCFAGSMSLAQQTLALNLMTAHLLFLSEAIQAGNAPGVVIAGSIDKVSVTMEPPPAPNQWQYWLQTTPYGQQLLSLLQVASVGGFYASSAVPGRAGFQFGNGW